jgi:hypothetical protein
MSKRATDFSIHMYITFRDNLHVHFLFMRTVNYSTLKKKVIPSNISMLQLIVM